MSANHYKGQLQDTLVKLQGSQVSAREWRQVANNRLLLLVAIDGALNIQIHHLLKVGTTFGVSPQDPGMPVADLDRHSADEVASFILQKIDAASSFTANLTREAVSLQATLLETLSVALSAQEIPRPVMDLKVKDYTQQVNDASTPLKDIFEEIEGETLQFTHNTCESVPTHDHTESDHSESTSTIKEDDICPLSYEMEQALTLFSHK